MLYVDRVIVIRGTHPYAFRSGEWARLISYDWVQPRPTGDGRLCYVVQFDDGVTDKWPVADSGYGYEFRWMNLLDTVTR